MNVRRTSAIVIVGCFVLDLVLLSLVLAGCGGKPTTPRGQGVVYLNSLPGRAVVHLDGMNTGTLTPDTLFVREGDHTLTLTLAGYQDSTFTFTMVRADTISFDVELVPEAGTLTWTLVPGVGATIFGVDFATLTYGCAVGENGRVFRTSNGGVSWGEGVSGTSENLLSVSFASVSLGWACGTNGTILRTTDYGATWDSLPSSTGKTLHDIFFVDATNGWAVGDSGKILRSTDGGLSWTPQSSGTAKNLSAVYFFNTSLGWAVGGYLSGEGQVILRTTNSGLNWFPMSTVSTSCLRDVLFITVSTGLSVGDDGLLLRSTDGGISWGPVGSVGPISLRALAAWSNTDCWAVGDRHGASGEIFKSIDGGLTWFPFEETPQALFCVDAIKNVPSGWAGGVGGLWEYR